MYDKVSRSWLAGRKVLLPDGSAATLSGFREDGCAWAVRPGGKQVIVDPGECLIRDPQTKVWTEGWKLTDGVLQNWRLGVPKAKQPDSDDVPVQHRLPGM